MKEKRKLRPYQQELLDETELQNNHILPLFWRMRTGKSIVTIRWIDQYCKNNASQDNYQPRVLIICPKTVIVSWKEELEQENKKYVVLTTLNKDIHHYLLQPIWCITNYETLTAQDTYLQNLPWDVVIVDEGTRIRNPNTFISTILTNKHSFPVMAVDEVTGCSFISKLPNQLRAILTGTPAPETLLDYFQQFIFLYGEWFNHYNYFQFRKDYFYLDQTRSNKYLPNFGVRPKVAEFIKNNAYVMSHKAAGIDLPNAYEKRIVELNSATRKIYDEFENDWQVTILDELQKVDNKRSLGQLITNFATVAQNYLHQLACGFPKSLPDFSAKHKLKELLSLLYGELRNEKTVIWCRYLRDIDEIYKVLLNKGIRHPGKIIGGMSTAQLQNTLNRFNATKAAIPMPHDTLICQIRKASMGMDLSTADTQIFFSRSWSALENEQAIDRLIHPLKKEKPDFQSLLTIDIITKDTIDEDLLTALGDKKAESQVLKLFMERINGKKRKTNSSREVSAGI